MYYRGQKRRRKRLLYPEIQRLADLVNQAFGLRT